MTNSGICQVCVRSEGVFSVEDPTYFTNIYTLWLNIYEMESLPRAS